MIRVGFAYVVVGAVFAAIAVASAADRANAKRWTTASFWALFALSFLAGDQIGDLGNGILVLLLVGLGGLGGLGAGRPNTTTPRERDAISARLGPRLFLPVLIVPVTTLVGAVVFRSLTFGGRPVVDPAQSTVVALALGALLGLAAAMLLVRSGPAAAIEEARRLMDSVGWAAILPQLLAALGAVFTLAGVGRAVGGLLGHALPLDSRLAAVATYGLGMALFTMVMGNAFAALPVMMAAIGAPILVGRFGGDAAAVGALGMLSGFCGTLMTPMASHNIVPTALLGLPQGAVIRVQAPTAILLLAANIALMDVLAFR